MSTATAPHHRNSFEYVRPYLYPKQVAAIFAPTRYAEIEASTKSGKTHGCIVWLIEQALQAQPGQHCWWVAPWYQAAEIAYRRAKRALPPFLYKANEQKLNLTLANEVTLWFKTGEKPDALYGEDVVAAVLDEASRMRAEAFHAVRSTLTYTQGQIRLIGNVKGRRNWFWQLCRKAETGAEGHSYHKLTWQDAVDGGVMSAAEVEDAKSVLPEAVWRELYEAEASDDQGNPFGFEAIRQARGPLSDRPVAVWGVDLAKSVDWTWAIGLDVDGGVSQSVRWQSPWQETLLRLEQLLGETPAYLDSTGVGDPIVEQLQRKLPTVQGYKFTSQSKQQLMEGLAVALQSRTLSGIPADLAAELEAFEYEYTRGGCRYCVAPETKVLTQDLRWVEAGSLKENQALLAFDEFPSLARKRCWRIARVVSADTIIRPSYRLHLSDGTRVVCSAEHRWLVHAGGDLVWKETQHLRGRHSTSRSLRYAPHRLVRLLPVWQTAESYAAGYLAAAFDGEGHCSQVVKHAGRGHGCRIAFAQIENAMMDTVRAYLHDEGFHWSESHNGGGTNKNVRSLSLTGGRHEILKFLGAIRPKRLLENIALQKLGVLSALHYPTIEDIEPLGLQAVIALQTTTGTFVAEGLASHNSAPEGMHDDGVCALALAQARRLAFVPFDIAGGGATAVLEPVEHYGQQVDSDVLAEIRRW